MHRADGKCISQPVFAYQCWKIRPELSTRETSFSFVHVLCDICSALVGRHCNFMYGNHVEQVPSEHSIRLLGTDSNLIAEMVLIEDCGYKQSTENIA